MVNCELERKWRKSSYGQIQATIPTSGGHKANNKNVCQDSSLPEIRTGYFLNTSLKHCINLFGPKRHHMMLITGGNISKAI